MEKDKETLEVFVRIPIEERLPVESGNYITTLQKPDGTLVVKKTYYGNGFKLHAGRRTWKVINWFCRSTVPLGTDLIYLR